MAREGSDDPRAGAFLALIDVMARLRDPDSGCEWDKAQTCETIAPYTIEEAYEVADAIARADVADLRDELGDLQLQVVYHARIAEEAGLFTIADVMAAIVDKMVRRHPHVFGDAPHSPGWEMLKASERAARTEDTSALAGVARSLPALIRAEKVQKRAARVGFDWPDPSGPLAKIAEELDEIAAAQSAEERAAEIGDLLFSVVNYARHLQIAPEAALRDATARFERRFRIVEKQADKPLQDMDLTALETLWTQAKMAD